MKFNKHAIANASFQAAIDKAGAANVEGDRYTMANQREAIRDTEQRKLNAVLQQFNERYEGAVARIAGKRDAAVSAFASQVKIWAIILPATICLLILVVWSNRVINARMDVPVNRRRTKLMGSARILPRQLWWCFSTCDRFTGMVASSTGGALGPLDRTVKLLAKRRRLMT